MSLYPSVCPNCGGWSGGTAIHQCPPNPPRVQPDDRIASALERIAGALERLVAKEEQ